MSDARPTLDQPPDKALLELITGYWVSQAIFAAAKLGIADLLRDGPRSCDDLAADTGVLAGPLSRLLRALAGVGVFRGYEGRPGWFGLTPLANGLRSDVPDSQLAFALLQEYQYRPWGEVLHSLATEETGFERVFGQPFFAYLADHPSAASVFNEAMADRTVEVADAVVDAYDFHRVGTLVDVGGGSGLLLTTILAAHPALHGLLYDLPPVVVAARQRIAGAGLSGRCEARGGDFFASVPSDGDCYLLKWIIHDWDDDRAIDILAGCRQAMAPDDRVLVIEAVLSAGNEPTFSNWIDLTMLTVTGGRERTADEYRGLFSAAGLRLTRVIPTATEASSILEGARA